MPCGSVIKNPSANAGDMGSIPGSERYPGEGNSNPLWYSCWKTPWAEEPGRLQSMGFQTIGHDLATRKQQEQKYTKAQHCGGCTHMTVLTRRVN